MTVDLERLNVRTFLEEAVARNADRPFLLWDDTVQTYGDFDRAVDRAAALWHDIGVRRGDRVAFLADNSPAFLHAWLGLAKLGAVLVAVNTGFTADEAAYPIAHSEARFALVDPAHTAVAQRVRRQVPGLEAVFATGPDGPGPDFAAAAVELDGAAPPVDLVGDDLVSLIYTSGTTGRPKGVMQTHRNYVLTGQAYPAWMRMARGDRIYACLPLFHINSQAYSTMGAIGAEGALVLAPRFSAGRFWPDVRRHGVTVFNFIGAMTVILSKKPPGPDDRDHAVRVAYGVPALPPDVRADIEERFGLACISGFGMSETTFGLLEPPDGPRKPGTMGVPRSHPDPSVPLTEAKVVDGRGAEVPRGQVGELVLRTAATMLGYFRDPERTAEALRDGWLHTGDTAYQDDDGWFFFVDRKKDIVRRRGENVSSLEVETVLNAHDDVLESAVIGVPSELTDEELCAFVVAKPDHGVDARALVDWAAQHLAPFKLPRYVEVVDALPKTPTSKIEKYALRAGRYASGHREDLAPPAGAATPRRAS